MQFSARSTLQIPIDAQNNFLRADSFLAGYRKSVELAEPVIGLARMRRYREAVDSTENVLEAFRESEGLARVEKDDTAGNAKLRFLRLCRDMWPDAAVEWLDAALILTADKPSYNPLFGTGGNEGHFDIAANFAGRLSKAFAGRRDASGGWLDAALFAGGAALDGLTTSGHNPRGSGRPNSGRSYDGRSVSNPWEHMLMVEGMLMFAGGVSRRTARRPGWSAFPFVVDAIRAGYAAAANEEDRGEIWLPLWSRPASYMETLLVLREGRASYGGLPAKTGADFALAAASLGVDRGIAGFRRFAALERKGENMMTVNAGRMPVRDAPGAALVGDIMQWRGMVLRYARSAKSPPHSLREAARRLDGCMFGVCEDPGPAAVRSLPAAFGRLERVVSGRSWPAGSGVVPFPACLSAGWLRAADDGSAEFGLAAAAASITGGAGYMRENLEGVKCEGGKWVADGLSASCVWREGAALHDNLGYVCMRRVMEAKAAKPGVPPLRGTVAADLGDVEEFLAGVLDEQKIADLLLPLSMVRLDGPAHDVGREENPIPVPAAYALVKSVYDTPGVPDMDVLSLLEAGRAVEALESARRRARASGMVRGAGAVAGEPPACVAGRLLGSLAFPVARADRTGLLDVAGLRESSAA